MLHTQLCDLLGIDHPVISAPMAGSAGAELAAAVSAAGGFGMIGANGFDDPAALREQIHRVRRLTDRPFGVGFVSSFPSTSELMPVALEERVTAISHSFADPTPFVRPAHHAGVKILAQVQTVEQARQAAEAGVDGIAAQGTEAGGHTGMSSATLPLVPAVIDAVGNVPVVAAGGIADGRGLAAVLMLGAAGAWIGTRFIASHECGGGEWRKAEIVKLGTDDTVLTRVYDIALDLPFPEGIAERVLRNDFTTTWHGREEEVEARRDELAARLDLAAKTEDPQMFKILAGNAIGLIDAVEPAGDILRRIIAEAEWILRERPAQVLR